MMLKHEVAGAAAAAARSPSRAQAQLRRPGVNRTTVFRGPTSVSER